MSSSLGQFEFFNFWSRYKWTATNFEDFEQTAKLYASTLALGIAPAVIKGGAFVTSSSFSMTVAGLLAVNAVGFPLYKSGNTTGISVGAPSPSQGRWSLVVARSKTTDLNPISEPTNPSNTVYLNTREETEIVVIDGTIAPSPSYPSKLAGDVILFGIKLPPAASDVLSSYIDYTVTEYPSKVMELHKVGQQYDAVVGVGQFCTHQSINDVMADSNIANIRTILIAEDATLNTQQNVSQPNKRIVFKPGVNYTKGSATGAIRVTAVNVDIEGGRFVGFSGGSDAAIDFQTGANYGNVLRSRFNTCTQAVKDGTVSGINVLAIHEEA